MAIILDQISTVKQNTSVSSFSFNVAVTAGLTGGLIILFAQTHSTGSISITAATYNSVAMTKANRQNSIGAATTEIWYLVNPASGTNSLSVTLSGSAGFYDAVAISYSGVDQSTPMDATAVGQSVASGSTSNSLSITTVTNGAVVVDCVNAGAAPTLTVGGSQTKDVDNTNTNSDKFGVSHQLKTTAGITTMTWNFGPSTGGASALSVAALRPIIAPSGKLSLMPDLDGLGGIGQMRFNRIQ